MKIVSFEAARRANFRANLSTDYLKDMLFTLASDHLIVGRKPNTHIGHEVRYNARTKKLSVKMWTNRPRRMGEWISVSDPAMIEALDVLYFKVRVL